MPAYPSLWKCIAHQIHAAATRPWRQAWLCAVAHAMLFVVSPHALAAQRPNIVVLVADDWGYSDVGAFGGEIATPALDALAKRGTRFSNFHVTATCSPTRSILMTGVDNHRNGVGNMPETMPAEQEGKPDYEGVLNDQSVTLATMLKDNGYHTYITGKWHLGKAPNQLPGNRGFERSFIQADSGSDNWEHRTYMMLYDKAHWFEQDHEVTTLPSDFYSSKFFVDKAHEYIGANLADGKPFFAYIGFQANHIPLQAPAEFVAKYKGKYDAGWAALREARRQRAIALGLVPPSTATVKLDSTLDWDALSPADKQLQAHHMEVYAAMAEAMDFHVGRLIQHLKDIGQYDNTVFVFLSDNGSDPADPLNIGLAKAWLGMNYTTNTLALGEKGTFSANGPSWASATVSPLSGYKYFGSEGGLRVPLIITGVAGERADQQTHALTQVKDIVPTLLDVAGITPHQGIYQGRTVERMDGRSMLALLQGKDSHVYGPNDAVGYELSGCQVVFKGDYKLVKNIAPLGDGKWHLYNLAQDPGEAHDLAAELPDVVTALRADYAAYAKANGVLPVAPDFDLQAAGLRYAVHSYLLPKLRAALPVFGGVVALAFALVVARRRRRAAARKR